MEETNEYRPNIALDEKGIPEALSLAEGIYKILDRRNAKDAVLLDVREQINLTDYFVICTAQSSTHLRALADEVEYRLGLCGIKVDNREGKGDGNSWIVLDCIHVMVHLFTPDARKFYALDRLYPEAKKCEVAPDPEEEKTETEENGK